MDLSNEQKIARAEFKTFVETEVAPIAATCDKAEEMSSGLLKRVGTCGYFGLTLPKSYGGRDADMITFGLLHRRIGGAWPSLRNIIASHAMVAHAVCRWGSDAVKAVLPRLASGEIIAAFCLTEPSAGSSANSIEARASQVPGGYLLNGDKQWVTAGEIAAIYLVFARTDQGSCALLVDRDSAGVNINPVRGMLGAPASMLAHISFRDCFVPENRLVGGLGFGISHVAYTALDLARYSVACGSVGIAATCLFASRQYAAERCQFGKPIDEHQLIQKIIAEAAVNTHAAWLMCLRAGALRDRQDPSAILETAMAKYFASRVAVSVSSDAIQIHGARGCSADLPLARLYQDARLMEIIDGTTQIMEVLIARLLKGDSRLYGESDEC